LLVTGGFYIVHQVVYLLVARNILGHSMDFLWGRTALAALLNGLLAVAVFALLDRFKRNA